MYLSGLSGEELPLMWAGAIHELRTQISPTAVICYLPAALGYQRHRFFGLHSLGLQAFSFELRIRSPASRGPILLDLNCAVLLADILSWNFSTSIISRANSPD
jgi:hypothetical protein